MEVCTWVEGLSTTAFSLYLVAVFLGTIALCVVVDRLVVKRLFSRRQHINITHGNSQNLVQTT